MASVATQTIQGTVLYAPGDVRIAELPAPEIVEPTDAIIRISAACVCGSDLWPYRGIDALAEPRLIGHEYCGVVEQVGSSVTNIMPGQFVIGSFFASDNTCPHCRTGISRVASMQHRSPVRRRAWGARRRIAEKP